MKAEKMHLKTAASSSTNSLEDSNEAFASECYKFYILQELKMGTRLVHVDLRSGSQVFRLKSTGFKHICNPREHLLKSLPPFICLYT
jgi:hypothetical protein